MVEARRIPRAPTLSPTAVKWSTSLILADLSNFDKQTGVEHQGTTAATPEEVPRFSSAGWAGNLSTSSFTFFLRDLGQLSTRQCKHLDDYPFCSGMSEDFRLDPASSNSAGSASSESGGARAVPCFSCFTGLGWASAASSRMLERSTPG